MAVAPALPVAAARVVEAAGCMVARLHRHARPHSDFALLAHPSAEAKVRQGVTTEVTGMCGFSPGSGGAGRRAPAGVGRVPLPGARLGVDQLRLLARPAAAGRASPGNVVPFVGHGTLRIAAMGFERRPPTQDEARRMDLLLGEALDAGAFGMSTGLIYAPSVYADTAELIGLVQTLGRRPGRLYTSHIRGEGPTLEAAIGEAIRIGDEGGVPPSRSPT